MNYLGKTLLLVLLVLFALFSLSYIPESITTRLGLRRIDILSDIRPSADSLANDTAVISVAPPAFVDTCKTGLVCFEDFSDNHSGMDAFYMALDKLPKLGRPVRIAFFGDSYIEGDIFSSDLRALLQEHLGGAGVGLVGAASPTAGFRQTVKHTFSGWKSYSLVDSSKGDYGKMGMAGNYFVPTGNAWSRYIGINSTTLDTVQRARLLYRLPSGAAELSYKVNNSDAKKLTLYGGDGVQCINIVDTTGIGSLQLNFAKVDGLSVYGVSLEDSTGLIVDNFSLRGMPGPSLVSIPQESLKGFNKYLSYDLIILEYGLNAMSSKVTNYKRYKEDMGKAVNHLKAAFPKSSILLLSVGDRSMKKEGAYVTMPGIPAMVSYQKAVCSETGIVFWNMFEAMGGSGSMPKMVASKPARANKDYTHLTFAGGKYLGGILFETLSYGREQYQRRKKHGK